MKKVTLKQNMCRHLYTAKVKIYKKPCKTGDVVAISHTCKKCKLRLKNKVIKPYTECRETIDDIVMDGRKQNE